MPTTLLALVFALGAGDPVVFDDAVQPQVGVAPDGTVYVVMIKGGNIVVARSEDKGLSFGDPVIALDAMGRVQGGLRRGPRIGIDGKGNLVVTSPAAFDEKEFKRRFPSQDLWLVRSSNQGRTWTKPVQINEASKKAPEALHWLAVAQNGDAHVAWLDMRERHKNMLWYSKVKGLKVGKNMRITDLVCECCAPGLSVDGKGNPVATVREGGINQNRAMLLILSRNGGRSFRRPVPVNETPTGIPN